MVKLECDIPSQNCASLFSRTNSTLIKLQYQSGSCVRDPRLPGNVGRCGFPGAACAVDPKGNDNCAYGGDSTVPNYKPLCRNGVCGGGLGAICTNGDFDCNWGYYCNTSAPAPGVCGGQGAFASDQGDDGDFAADYCLSGKANLASNGAYYCLGGVFNAVIPTTVSSTALSSLASSISSGGAGSTGIIPLPQGGPISGSLSSSLSTSGSNPSTTGSSNGSSNNANDNAQNTHTSSSKTPIIAGVCAGVGIVLLSILAFLAWRHFRKPKANMIPREDISYPAPIPAQPTSGSGSSGLSPVRPAFVTNATPPSFPVANANSFTYLPEIQGDGGSSRNTGGSSFQTGYQPVLPSPHYNFALGGAAANGSNPSIAQDPFMTPLPAEIVAQGTGQYSTGGQPLDATERHLLAARGEAERHLREYDQRAR
ncbi:hypothetical protein CPC08DRAFT_818120 [Agrocybe pediades]|nr:hypothetical protein CPC08DRAFT_818120 [Agrocybe pediades]